MIHTAELFHQTNLRLYKQFNNLASTNFHEQKELLVNNSLDKNGLNLTAKIYHTSSGISYAQFTLIVNFRQATEKHKTIKLYEPKDFAITAERFNILLQRLLPGLPDFNSWKVRRIDYAIDISTPYVKEYIHLLKKGAFPPHMDSIKANYHQRPGSLYLRSKSITVNYYDKEAQQLNQKAKGFSVPKLKLQEAHNILRLEIQCHKSRTDYLKVKYAFEAKYLPYFLDPHISFDVLEKPLRQIAGTGDYVRKATAFKKIDASKYTHKTKEALKDIINVVAVQHSSVQKVHDEFVANGTMTSDAFKRHLKRFNELDISPVVIGDKQKIEGKTLKEGLPCLYTQLSEKFDKLQADASADTSL